MCRLLLNSPPNWKFSWVQELEKRSKACHSIDISEYSGNTIKWKFKSLHNCQKYELSFLYIIFPEKFRKTLRWYCFFMRSLRIGISRNSKSKFTLLNGKFPYLLADYDFEFSLRLKLFFLFLSAEGLSSRLKYWVLYWKYIFRFSIWFWLFLHRFVAVRISFAVYIFLAYCQLTAETLSEALKGGGGGWGRGVAYLFHLFQPCLMGGGGGLNWEVGLFNLGL